MVDDAEILPEQDTGIASEDEWQAILDATAPALRELVADIVAEHAEYLSRHFYATMMTDAQAGIYLSHQLVEERLSMAMRRWLCNLFAVGTPEEVAAAVAYQRHVGDTHARIKLPIRLVSHGARYLKHRIWEYLANETRLERGELHQAVIFANDLIDHAIEIMTTSFISNSDRAARTEEVYRLFSLSQDLAIERERQRASLLEWGQKIILALYRRPLSSSLPRICHSEFGLWLMHKALFMFERSVEVQQIVTIVERIDAQLVPRLAATLTQDELSALLGQLENEISQIKFLLSTLFDRYLEVENGRDVLTKLFNRRFLPSALMREIELAKRTRRNFAVMLIDIDHFKTVNDTHGHDAGDVVLQQTAALIMNTVRAGDFIFRYGGEEILVILVDVDHKTTKGVAESLRQKIEQSSFLLSGGNSLRLTVSIGLAIYDGHPDYQVLITRADAALYEAKNSGRNRSVFANPG